MAHARITGRELVNFKKPARLFISRLSGSGKSTFICKLIEKYGNKFQRIIVLGSERGILKEFDIEFNEEFNLYQEFREVLHF